MKQDRLKRLQLKLMNIQHEMDDMGLQLNNMPEWVAGDIETILEGDDQTYFICIDCGDIHVDEKMFYLDDDSPVCAVCNQKRICRSKGETNDHV